MGWGGIGVGGGVGLLFCWLVGWEPGQPMVIFDEFGARSK